MKTYIRTQTVKAEAVKTHADAEKLAGRKLTIHGTYTKELPQGYLVQLEDGTMAFFSQQEFESNFKCAEDFLDRLHIERDELSARLTKLRAFTQTAWFDSFPERSKELMKKQEELMSGYLTVLTARIELAEGE